jgi:hypothetical protein
MSDYKLRPHVVDQFVAASSEANDIIDTYRVSVDGPVIVARDTVSDFLRKRLHTAAVSDAGCPHTGDKVFESPRPIISRLDRSIRSCPECLHVMLHNFANTREGCNLCTEPTATTTLLVKDRYVVWRAEICDDCSTTINQAQRERFGPPRTDDLEWTDPA